MTMHISPFRLAGIATLGATLLVSGCAYEAGSQLATSDFGNATMNNHLVQTCQAGPATAQGKYVSKTGGCAGRELDGKYARVTYGEYVGDAVARPRITNFSTVQQAVSD